MGFDFDDAMPMVIVIGMILIACISILAIPSDVSTPTDTPELTADKALYECAYEKGKGFSIPDISDADARNALESLIKERRRNQ